MKASTILDLLWAGWAVYWMISAFGNKRTQRRAGRGWRISTIAVAFILYLIFSAFPGYLHRRLIAYDPSIAAAGVVLCALGIGFSIWARIILGRNWSATPTVKEGHELVQAGPYGLVRHPIYTGLLLAIFGSCLCGCRIMDLVIFVVVFVMLVFKLRVEESLMMQQFPQVYPEYRARTKALIPFIF